MVSAYLVRDFFTDRAQIISYMLFMIEINLIENFLRNKKIRNIVGIFLISVIIANSHVAVWPFMFVLVLPFLGEYLFSLFTLSNVVKRRIKSDESKLERLKTKKANSKKIEKMEKSINEDKEFLKNYKPKEGKKITITKNDNAKYLFLILIVIFIGGFLTPTGNLPFTYFIKAYYSNAMNYINEHIPIVVASSVEFVAFIIVTITCIGFIDSKITLSEAFLLLGLYFMTIVSRRHLVLLVLLGASILIYMLNEFIERNLNKDKDWKIRKDLTEKCLFIFFAIVAIGVRNISNKKQLSNRIY